jgi:type III secretion protein S
VTLDDLIRLGQEALVLAVMLSLPLVAVAALVGLVSALLQSMSSIHDAALSHLPRLVAVALAIGAMASWMGSQLVAFAERAWGG